MFNYYVSALKNYAVFKGAASRPEYWWFALVNFLIMLALSLLGLDLVYLIYAIAVFVPSLAICVRRLHDMGLSGWHCLWGLLPVVGPIVLLVLLCMPTKTSGNKYR